MLNPAHGPNIQVLGKLLFFTLSCGILIGLSIPEPKLNDLIKKQLKGNVKSLLETRTGTAENEGDTTLGDITYSKITNYNPDGFESEVKIYNASGESSTVYYKFDTAGYQVGFDEYSDDGSLWLSVSYKLNEKGFRTEAIYNWQGIKGYDEIREKSEQLYEVLTRDPWEKVLYKNDYRGFPLEEKYLKSNGVLLFKFTYRYDILGNKVEMNYFNSKGRTSWVTKYKYDRYNNLVESTIFKSNREASRSQYTYQYDAIGNWIYRMEKRQVNVNILTSSLKSGIFLIKREIDYY